MKPRPPIHSPWLAAAGVLLVAVLTALSPARRAMTVDPMAALRHEGTSCSPGVVADLQIGLPPSSLVPGWNLYVRTACGLLGASVTLKKTWLSAPGLQVIFESRASSGATGGGL